MKTLNEEIERMKSLFSEERLYGNLVEKDGEDPFSGKAIRKSAKKQKKSDKAKEKNIAQNKKQKEKMSQKRDKQDTKNRDKFKKFCIKQVGIFDNLFVDKKVRLDSDSNTGKPWNDLLKTSKPKCINVNNEDTQFNSYKDLLTQCKNAGFSNEELETPSLDNLITLVDTDIDIAQRNKLITTKKDDSKDGGENVVSDKEGTGENEEKDKTNYKKIKPQTFKTVENFDGGEIKVIAKNKFKIIPKGTFRPVDRSKGKNKYDTHTLLPDFEQGIKDALVALRNDAKSNNIELKTDGNIKFVDNYIFEVI